MTDQSLFLPRGFDYTTDEPFKEVVNTEPGIKNNGWGERFDEWEDEDVIKHLHSEMFIKPRKLADGSWVAISRLTTTWSVCCDITRITPYAYRWCFLDLAEAEYFLENIQEFDEIPERRSSLTGHRFSRYARLAAFDHLGLKRW